MMKLSDFESDNFMEICFKNKENVYSEGPGAGLEENKNLMLCLKNVPKTMDNQALKNILSNFGDVLRVTQMHDAFNPLRFAECKDETSLEAVLRGMSINEWNIQVSQKIEKKVEASCSEKSLEFHSYSSKGISEDLLKSDVKNLLYPSLIILKSPEFSNQSKETAYFQNRRILDHIYNIGKCSTNSVSCNSRYHFTNLFDNKYYKDSKNLESLEIGICFVCRKYAVNYCEQCKEFYCSKECQDADWPTHRFTCTQNKQLTRLKHSKINCDPYKNLRIQNDMENKIRSGVSVVITHIEKSNCVFIRSVEENDHIDYVRIVNTVASFGAVTKKIPNLLIAGDFVLAQYNFEWFRAIILDSTNENEVLLAYPDLGCTMLKSKPELREFPEELRDIKRLVYCVFLQDVPDVVLNKNARDFLHHLIDENVKLKIQHVYRRNDFSFVELKAIGTNQNVNKRLNILINPIKPTIHDIPIFLNDITVIKFKPCRDAKLIVLDNSFIELGFISCILNNDAEELDKINSQVTAYAESDRDFYTPREGEICLVKASDKPNTWYRAICEVVSGDGKPILTLLDFGSIYNISINNIRKCPKQLSLPCFTNHCYIKGLQTIAKEKKINNFAKTKLLDFIKLHALLIVPEIEIIDGETFITLPKEIVRNIKDSKIIEYNGLKIFK